MVGGVAPTASAEGEKINILKTKSEVKKKERKNVNLFCSNMFILLFLSSP
ncbi:hypothetical protein CUZ95_2649 [Enterococcus lactis]|nr:hypothetical protein [Enterococcus lactis]